MLCSPGTLMPFNTFGFSGTNAGSRLSVNRSIAAFTVGSPQTRTKTTSSR